MTLAEIEELQKSTRESYRIVRENNEKLLRESQERIDREYGFKPPESAPESPWQPLSPQELYNARLTNPDAWKQHLEETEKQWS
jgi:hypothetical protein